MQLGIEHLVRNRRTLHVEHAGKKLGNFNGSSAHKHRTSFVDEFYNFVDYGLVLLFLGAVHTVVHVDAGNRTVCGNCHHIELIDIPELTGLCDSRTGHTGELVIHAEVVLECDCGKSLGSCLNFHAFFGFDSLVETVGVATTFHDTARLLVDNLDFVFVDYVFDIALEESVSLEELCHSVHALRLYGIICHKLIFALLTLGGVGDMFEFRKLRGDVGKHEKLRVLGIARKLVDTFVSELDRAVLFVDNEVERVGDNRHFARIVLQIVGFCLEESVLHALLAEEAYKRTVLGQTLICAEEEQCAFFAHGLVLRGQFFFCIGKNTGHESLLSLDNLLYICLVFIEKLVVATGRRT